jgi:hypothetical protein
MEQYDKFLPLGHLAFYRNTVECNHYYKLEGSRCGDYQTVLADENNHAFDEISGIYAIYEYNGLPMFIKRIFAEIKTYHKRFRLKKCDRNYKHQVFYYENGKIWRAYAGEGGIKTEEFIYIHFRRKLTADAAVSWKELKSFYLSPEGFHEKQPGIPDVKEIERYNHNPGNIYELCETLLFCLKNVKKIRSKVENERIARKGMR